MNTLKIFIIACLASIVYGRSGGKSIKLDNGRFCVSSNQCASRNCSESTCATKWYQEDDSYRDYKIEEQNFLGKEMKKKNGNIQGDMCFYDVKRQVYIQYSTFNMYIYITT